MMGRSKLVIISDDQNVVQRAKAFAASNGLYCEVYSSVEWEGKSNMSQLSTGTEPVSTGAKILPFPGTQGYTGNARRVQTINELESVAIEKAINEYNGNLTEAARALGIGRATLYRKVKQYNLDPAQARKKRAA